VSEIPLPAWRARLKPRLVVAAGLMALWAAAIESRLVYLQVLQHQELLARAQRQQMRTVTSSANRGEILDRRGRVLAYSVDAETIYAVPTAIADPAKAAAALCGALRDCSAKERKALAERLAGGKAFAYVKRQVSPEQARRVAALELEGVGFIKENRRYYPNRELAAQVLGYVGLDNQGLGGIEARYDSIIRGREGTVLVQADARGRAFSRVERPSTAGATLELTIDHRLQHIVERELEGGVKASGAAGGSAVVMEPTTGEILALASYPTFNPNAYRDFVEKFRRNRAITDAYEPGSTFKLVTASAALEEGLIEPADMIDVRGGRIAFGSRVIHDTHDYGVLSFEDVIVKSSNVGAIKVGLKLGPNRMVDYVRRFGFGRPSSPDFRGESSGIVWSADTLTPSALASVAMGYQVGVTPLQMASAASVVANGGELIEPRVVRAVVRGGTRSLVPRKVLGRVISRETAAKLGLMMEGVVERGTATLAQVEGYAIAGKTGTAKKLVNGSYRGHSDYNVSFVGFVPARSPQFAVIVVVDSPHAVSAFGGTVAAPIFQSTARNALRLYGVAPSVNAPPPVLVDRGHVEQNVFGPAHTPALVPVDTTAGGTPVIPDLTGMSARDALAALARLGLSTRLHGGGVVASQRPEAGAPIDTNVVATVWLTRRPDDGERRP
jgi:cell division protein FtsI (penicillin-binding protein 3)